MNDALLDALIDALHAREAVALITVTTATGARARMLGKRMLVWQAMERAPIGALEADADLLARILAAAANALGRGAHAQFEETAADSEVSCFIEVQSPPAHLIICGAGHIAVPLATIARLCDFEVSVIDDRADYANRSRFPTADHVAAGDFRAELSALRRGKERFDARTCVVLVTRGHQHDVDCLIELLADPLPYIGMIGSRRRIRAVHAMLADEYALAPEHFTNLYAPVGLAIGAQSPAEIAVAIMGELINVLRGGPGLSLRDAPRAVNAREPK